MSARSQPRHSPRRRTRHGDGNDHERKRESRGLADGEASHHVVAHVALRRRAVRREHQPAQGQHQKDRSQALVMSASELVERDEHVVPQNGFPGYYVPYKLSDYVRAGHRSAGALERRRLIARRIDPSTYIM